VPRRNFYPLLLVVITLLVLGRIATHEFVWWDDPQTIFHNPRLNPPSAEKIMWYWGHAEFSIYIPFTYTVWGMIASMARLDAPDEAGIWLNPWMFHIASLLVHVGSVLVVYQVLRRVVGREWSSFAGALIFAVHPVQVETVAWASGLKDLLCGFFALLAVWQYLLFMESSGEVRSRARWNYVAALAAFVLSMLSKPTGMLTPLLAGMIAYFAMRRELRRILLSLWPWVILSGICAVIAKLVQPGHGIPAPPLWARPLIAGDALAFYLLKLVAPVGLSVDYGRRPMVVLESKLIYFAWVLPALVALLAWRMRRTRPLLWVAIALFIAGLLPVLGLVPFLMQYYSTVTDHYLYLPMLGPALAIAWLLDHYKDRWIATAWTCWVVALATLAFLQAGHWRDDLTLWGNTLEVNNRSFLAHYGMGTGLARRGDYASAAGHLRRASEINPEFARAYLSYADVLFVQGKTDEAYETYLRYIEGLSRYPKSARPDIAGAHIDLGERLLLYQRPAEAVIQFNKALSIDPNRAAAKSGLERARQKAATRPGASGP